MAIRWIDAADLAKPQAPDADSAALTASWILYKLSGEKYPGTHTSTDWYGVDNTSPHLAWSISRSAGVTPMSHVNVFEVSDFTSPRLALRGRPVQRVDAVYAGAHELAQSSYFIGNKAFIVRADGQPWDFSQGVTVTYTHGVEPPEPGVRAAQRLANELVLSVEDPEQCALPDRVSSVSRQGLSYTILDPQDFLQDGRTGLYEIDLFLKAANPIGARKRPRVYSPDLPSGRRAT